MAKKGKTFNVEIGDSITKVCEVAVKGQGVETQNFFMFRTPAGAVSDGAVADAAALAGKLKEEFETRGIKHCKKVIFCLSSSQVATREVMLPPVKENRMKDLVAATAPEYFPIDLAQHHIAYKLLETVEGDEPANRVLIFAVPLSLLSGYFEIALHAGLEIEALDYSGNSQYQAFAALGKEQVTMYVNADCTNTVVTFMDHGRLILQRSVFFGGEDLIWAYMSATQKEDDEYVQALMDCVDPETQILEKEILNEDELKLNLYRMVNAVNRVADYFHTNHWESALENIVLLGPCAYMPRLKELLEEETGLSVEYLDKPPAVASTYISCVGSAIDPLDLIPPQFKKTKKQAGSSDANAIRDGIIICVVCALAAAAFSFFTIRQYRAVAEEKAQIQAQIEELSYVKGVYERHNAYRASADALLLLEEGINSPNDNLRAFIEELEKKMPSRILLLSAACNRESITMNITVPSFSDAAVALVQLRTFESLADIQTTSLSRQVDDLGGEYVSFSIICTYGENPYIKGQNPYVTERKALESVEAAAQQAEGDEAL